MISIRKAVIIVGLLLLMIGMPTVAGYLVVIVAGVAFFRMLIEYQATGTRTSPHTGDDVLANGYTRSDYYEQGLTDTELDAFDFDTDPTAPAPQDAGFAISEWVRENM